MHTSLDTLFFGLFLTFPNTGGNGGLPLDDDSGYRFGVKGKT
jgi:hypothetical protein